MRFDLIIKNGFVVDPMNAVHGVFDLGIKDKKVVEIAEDLDSAQALCVVDAAGQLVAPGIIDVHTHLSARHHGAFGHNMLAKAGVTTTLEIAGPVDSVLPIAKDSGVGLNMAMLDQVYPGVSVKDENPGTAELETLIDKTLAQGGIGIKLLGGHFPITPDSIAKAIELSWQKESYIAFHAGSTQTGSNLHGGLEAIDLARGKPLHLAHVNSYCRGYVHECYEEAGLMIDALLKNPNICSESYLSPMNGCSSKVKDGKAESMVTRKCLERGGYEISEQGIEQAILDGWALVNMISGGENIVCSGKEALAYWRKNGTVGSFGFRVNPAASRVRLAEARRPNGEFVVDCIATDGGGHPRNVIIECGLPLVELGVLTLGEFVVKTSCNPAKWLGLTEKGHLGVGADADITIINQKQQKATTTIVGGKVIMHQGIICGSGTHIITTERGRKAIKALNLEMTVIDIAKTGYFNGLSH